jgi:fatty-acyl-CoA synthase
VRGWGLTPAAAYGLAAIRHPERAAIVDDHGPLTFAEVDRRTDALAYALRRAGIDRRDTVAIMCRNHRWFVEATVACSTLGADILYLDPADSPSSRAERIRREDPQALIYDEEFSDRLHPVGRGRMHFIASCDADRPALCPVLEELIAREGSLAAAAPGRSRASRVLLDHGSPEGDQGADRKLRHSLVVPRASTSKTPLRRGEVTVVAAPIFGSWGFLHLMLGLRLASTLVLPRSFDPTGILDAVERYDATALAVLPETLTGIIRLPDAASESYDATTLRVIAVQGPALSSDVAIPAMRRFGDVLYSLHASTGVRLTGDWTRQPSASERAVGDLNLSGPSGEWAARQVAQR